MYYARKVVFPGERLDVEVVLISRSQTPVDWMEVRLLGNESTTVGEGKAQVTTWTPEVRDVRREPAMELGVGERRFRYGFDLPPDAAPTYHGLRCAVWYLLAVYVSIPWWPDRNADFTLPVSARPGQITAGEPRIVSSASAPMPGVPYLEVSIGNDELQPGATLLGAVSVSNTMSQRIRRIVASFVLKERVLHGPHYEAARYGAVVFEGSPPEGQPVEFRLRMPPEVHATFRARAFSLAWHLEIRADVSLASDVVASIPLRVVRGDAGTPLRAPGRYYPVGRDRFARLWAGVAQKLGMTLDEDGQTLRAARGPASLSIRRTYDGERFALRFDFAWPSLGMGVHVGERSWTDAIVGAWTSPSEQANARLAIRGREAAQLAAVFDRDLLLGLLSYQSVSIDDASAHLALSTAGTTSGVLEQACRSGLWLLERFSVATMRAPPPTVMASALEAWRSFAATVSGRLEIGSMSLREASLGVDRFDIETHWTDAEHVAATTVTFRVDPPLERVPADDDPSLSPAAREVLRAAKSTLKGLALEPATARFQLDGPVADPASLMPSLELVAKLSRALRGRPASGPFR